MNAVHSICKEWSTIIPELRKSQHRYEVYAHWEQNTRRKMEDKHIIITEVNNLFGFDKVSCTELCVTLTLKFSVLILMPDTSLGSSKYVNK